MYKQPLYYMSFIVIAFAMQSCYYDKEELLYPGSNQTVDCSTITAKFNTNVLPLMSSKCATSGCHDATARGGFSFSNYSQISGSKNAVLNAAVVQKNMPPSGSLQPAEMNIIKCWIEAGAPNN